MPQQPKVSSQDDYYAREHIAVVCEVEIAYKRGSPDSRAEAIASALRMERHVTGASRFGCYDVRVLNTKMAD